MNMKNRPVFRLMMFLVSVTFFSSCSGVSSPEPTSVSIDLSDAQALFTVSESSTSGLTLKNTSSEEALGQLRKILSDGTIEPVIYVADGEHVSADVTPSGVFVGPDGKVYIGFSVYGVLIDGKRCYLVRGAIGGPLDCIGPDDMGVTYAPFFSSSLNREAARFDSDNNYYFMVGRDGWVIQSLSADGVVSDRMSFSLYEVYAEGFEVGPDGTLFFTGKTRSTGQHYFRKTTATGGVADLPVDDSARDYMVSSGGDLFVAAGFGVTRLLQNSDWDIAETIALPALVLSDLPALVSAVGAGNSSLLMEDNSGNIYLLTESESIIYRIYPGIPVVVTHSTNLVSTAKTRNNLLYYIGEDSSNKNIFRRIDLTDETFPETDLLNGSSDIEVYRFQAWSNGNILFGGLRLSDNQLILGEIDGETLEMTVKTTTTTRIDELVLIQ